MRRALIRRHDPVDLLGAIQRDDGVDAALIQIERQEVARIEAPAHHDLIPLPMESGILQVDIVLIRPEPMDRIVRLPSTQHAAGRRGPLLHRVLPVLDAHASRKHRMVVIGDVAGRIDTLDARAAVFIDEDPGVGVDTAFSGSNAGGASTAPVVTSNWAPWQPQVTTVRSSVPSSPSEQCSCVQVSSIAKKRPLALATAMRTPSTSNAAISPDLTSAVLATIAVASPSSVLLQIISRITHLLRFAPVPPSREAETTDGDLHVLLPPPIPGEARAGPVPLCPPGPHRRTDFATFVRSVDPRQAVMTPQDHSE